MGWFEPLEYFRFDEQIDAEEVDLYDEERGEFVDVPIGVAIDIARQHGANLVASYSDPDREDPVPWCIISKVTTPLRWEQVPDDRPFPALDGDLWFEAFCGERDYLLEGASHTFPGRMLAWCPKNEYVYSVSLSEMGEMSDQTRYFVRGFLSGNEPEPLGENYGPVATEDLAAWKSATERFRQTGNWFGRWQTCGVCGCVLLPSTAGDRCCQHLEPVVAPPDAHDGAKSD